MTLEGLLSTLNGASKVRGLVRAFHQYENGCKDLHRRITVITMPLVRLNARCLLLKRFNTAISTYRAMMSLFWFTKLPNTHTLPHPQILSAVVKRISFVTYTAIPSAVVILTAVC